MFRAVIFAIATSIASAEYDCVCSSAEATEVFADPDNLTNTLGILTEDCKALHENDSTGDTYAILYNHQIGYVNKSHVEVKLCPGAIPAKDLLIASTSIDMSKLQTTPSEMRTTVQMLSTGVAGFASTSHETVIMSSTEHISTVESTALPDTEPTKMETTTFPTTTTTVVETTVHTIPLWPSGSYGLMKTTSGCPAGIWSEGWRRQDSEDIGNGNDFTDNIEMYMAGQFEGNILTEFCIKEDTSDSAADWPVGTYCILKKHACPTGFEEGYIYWDDEDLGNNNAGGGTLPDGEYNSNTKIFYCCRNDGPASEPIMLPTTLPFILVRYTSECQIVKGMDTKDLFVRWDDDDFFASSESGGKHPLDEDRGNDHLLHFCYYQSQSVGGPDVIIG